MPNDVTPQMYAETFSSPVGAAVLEHICDGSFVHQSTVHHLAAPVDTTQIFIREGMRMLALKIKELVRIGKTVGTAPPQTHARTLADQEVR